MSTIDPDSMRRRAGYWAPVAAKVAEDIRLGISTMPKTFSVHSAFYQDMKQFFADLTDAFEGKSGVCNDSYRLAMRALGFCFDNPFLVVEGKVVGIETLEEVDTKLVELIDLFYEKEGNAEEWKELADFIERVGVLDEADMFAPRKGYLIMGSCPRLH